MVIGMAEVGWTAADDDRAFSDEAFRDAGPWVRWLPLAWSAVADPIGRHPVPQLPVRMRRADTTTETHAELIAWWTPLDHLVRFGLGWNAPGKGLAAWCDLGRPTEHPVLKLIDRWWGDYVDHAIGWYNPLDSGRSARLRDDPIWQQVWSGGSDPMHLTGHRQPEVSPDYRPQRLQSSSGPEAVILTPSYAGWYEALRMAFPGGRPDGSSWRVAVVCRPIGWLGTYRRSRVSGRWFSGRHRWHQLGATTE